MSAKRDLNRFLQAMLILIMMGVAVAVVITLEESGQLIRPKPDAAYEAGRATAWAPHWATQTTVAQPTATPTPTPLRAAWYYWIEEMLSETDALVIASQVAVCVLPPVGDGKAWEEWAACLDAEGNRSARADMLYWELEHHAPPHPSCAQVARDQLAFALDDIRLGRSSMADEHLQAAILADPFCEVEP